MDVFTPGCTGGYSHSAAVAAESDICTDYDNSHEMQDECLVIPITEFEQRTCKILPSRAPKERNVNNRGRSPWYKHPLTPATLKELNNFKPLQGFKA